MLYFDPNVLVEIITNGENAEKAKQIYETIIDKELYVYEIHLGIVLAKLERKHYDYAKTFANAIKKLNIKLLHIDIKKLVELWAQLGSIEKAVFEIAKREGYEIVTI
ncbi:NEQ188 [Nanoarchaeum equitans Kin4-M]|uniref:NEQ188 n=1 Tax=Nanoarchaeum equitans (strain Kin4-M) TaxID=228908 RepID=Q74ND0_NANEQ|nr:NEQ188 [Nanoarchaeum equitans Kin4-M]